MWTHFAYRWLDQAAFQAALAAMGWAKGPPEGVSLHPVGVVLDDNGAALAGYHVAASFRAIAPPSDWAPHVITPPARMPMPGPTAIGPRILTVLQFRDRLTEAEEIAITAAGMASPAVRVWLDRLSGAQEVNLDDPRTVAGLNSMAEAGLLAPGRVVEILA
jgi:hypothetical protein